MKKKIFSLQYKFMLIALCISVIPLMIVGTVSYAKSMRIIEKQVSQSNLNTVQQIADNINGAFNALDTSAMYLWRDENFMNCLKATDDVKKNPSAYLLTAQHAVNSFAVIDTGIYSIYVKGYNGLVFDTSSASNIISPVLEQQLTKLKGDGILISDELTNYDGSVEKVFSFLRVFKDPDDLSRDLGIVKINISEKMISKIYGSTLLSSNSVIYVVDEQKNIISASDKGKIGTTLDASYFDPSFYAESSGYFFKEVNGQNMLVTFVDLNKSGWELIHIVPLAELSGDSTIIRKVTISAIVISIILCLLISFAFAFAVLSPLKKLRKSMKDIENENFNVVLSEKGNDEISLVCEGFNKMSKKLNELINEIYIVQLKKREAELMVLHEQINPHFLYNTLNTIYWMCKLEKAIESAKLVDGLSKLFRLSLNSGNEITTVRKEVEHLKYYMMIQNKRFEDMIHFDIQVSEDILHCSVVKLVLQPLVENAIHHGIEKKEKAGTIQVRIYKQADELIYEIIDDGPGADEADMNALLDQPEEGGRGFGIKNVNDRIKLHFGNSYGIRFRTAIGQGMTVIVKQPFSERGLS